MPQALRAIIADDEPLARQALRRFVSHDAQLSVVGEAEDVASLRALIATTTADVLFLDVTMPGGSGLDVIPSVPDGMAIVFTTAHAEYAAAAYEIDAVDYLVKPFGQDRVREALTRVRRYVTTRAAGTRRPVQVLLLRTGPRLHAVPLGEVWRLEGCDDFVRVVTAKGSWLHGATLAALTTRLDGASFLRVHRSHVVNLAHVSRVVPCDERRLAVQFPDGSRITCSRAGSTLLRRHARVRER